MSLYNIGKNILFDRMDFGENILIFYSNTKNHKIIFQNFIKKMDAENSILFYVSHNRNGLDFNFKSKKYLFSIITEKTIHKLETELDKSFSEMEEKSKNMLLIFDWSNINLNKCEIFVPFLENLIKKSQGAYPPDWKKKYKEKKQKVPLTIINAFETTNLNEKLIQQLIQLHQKVYLLQKNLNTFLLPTIAPAQDLIFPKYHVLPRRVLEKLVKSNLELITLLFLEKSNKSGYQILKEIANHFHCILSQGTLYPLIYSLEKEGKIIKSNGKGREVIYSLSKEIKKDLQIKKDIALKAYQHLASFFN